MDTFSVTVHGWLPPAKSEAKSLLAPNHPHLDRSLMRLRAVRDVLGPDAPIPSPVGSLGLVLVVTAEVAPPSDATNYLGGVGDVLQATWGAGDVSHLDRLASVAVFGNDRQLQEVIYRWEPGAGPGYTVRIWSREPA